MPLVTRCCCCDIRTGSMASAIYSMIYAALALGASAFKIHVDMQSASHLSQEERAFFIATCVDVAFFSLIFLSAIILLYGVKNYRRYLFIPFIICMSVLVVLQILLMFLLIFIMAVGVSTSGIIELLVIGLVTFLNLYCVLCVYSYYQDLRDGRGNMRAIYRAQGTTLPRTEAPPEKSGDINQLENANFVPPYPGPPMMNLYPGEPVVAPPPYQPPVDPQAFENKELYTPQV
ncbi:uncharacterized protein [Diadema antillarum]|uniref:uncharacterized protein n=1 Tax=Diadema antillarum TaxID=105358 RepID=UPI003A85AE89